MRTNEFGVGAAVLLLAAASALPAPSFAAEFYLKADVTTASLPNPDGGPPVDVPMWGYALCTGAASGCGPVTVPGPELQVPAGDSTLVVHLLNKLPVPTSMVIHGLLKKLVPVWDDGTSGSRPSLTARVRSFDAETGPNATGDYAWTNVKPGTYLYQSGTQPQVQVQMGLYGALSKNQQDPATPDGRSQAYADVPFDNQATLLYSEVDPALHAAVTGGTYGACPQATPGCGNLTSTLNYAPRYFLINGKPYPLNTTITPVGNPGTTLLRLLNAGLTTHVPLIQDAYWTVVAEDGKPHPYQTSQYTAFLPAAKTQDVLLTPDIGGGSYAILDRRLNLSNGGLPDGGMLVRVQYGASGGPIASSGNLAPVAADDSYTSTTGVTLYIGARGVLDNDSDPDGLPQPLKAVAASGTTSAGGQYQLGSSGAFMYTPPQGFVGQDTFTYRATDGNAQSNLATVRIDVSQPAAPVLAVLDSFDRADAVSLGTSWAQNATSNATPDVEVAGNAAFAASVSQGGLAIWNAGFGARQGASIRLVSAPARMALVLKASGGTVAAAPANFVRVRYEVNNGVGEVVVATMMGGSNVNVYVRQKGIPAAVSGPTTLGATVDEKGVVSVFLGGAFIGGVQLPDVGVWKGAGNIGIQLHTQGESVDDFSGGNL